ncbi:ketopantoate reductase [Thermoplasmatales archaeon SG8-52-4]|nr:MAG: ketopantoate reductase [Thermoplasmatales archaeon SG8-52-4]
MNIVIMGAGAIGSLFGALLNKKNNVILIGKKPHISAIKKSDLVIEGKTNLKVKISAEHSLDKIKLKPDLIFLTVKSYDTEFAIGQLIDIINEETIIISLQNGLDNIDKIKDYVDEEKIVAGITTHGAIFSKPGRIKHTGIGKTIIGELNGDITKRIKEIENLFNDSEIKTNISKDIIKEIWIKAIVNSSINPLSAFFQCKNGYLLKNPILERLLERICDESTKIANVEGLNLSNIEMIKKTKEVIKDTSENHSSMLQSILHSKKTEIDSINGKIVEIGIKNKIDPLINKILLHSIKSLS